MHAVGIRLSSKHLKQMLDHVAAEAPLEACGLLGGSNSQVQQVVPIRNVAESQVRFRMDPAEQIKAIFGFEEDGMELVAIYHSHPVGPPGPSGIDLGEAAYSEAVQLIWYLEQRDWRCRAYRYGDGGAIEVAIASISSEEEDGSQDL